MRIVIAHGGKLLVNNSMALKNLSRALESSSRILHDVEFVFIDNVFDETLTVNAHKVLLSIASDVFEAQNRLKVY